MADIVLAALNARYIHSSFGIRYLMANMGGLQSRACMVEADINQRPIEVAESILAHAPRIVGLGVYIWNATQAVELLALLKSIRPDIYIIVGGPEVSHGSEPHPVMPYVDCVIMGEADLCFSEVCAQVLEGISPGQKIISAAQPDLGRICMPYDLYTEADIAHRLIYVEASRGCPFKCEFCLSAMSGRVRQFPLEPFLEQLNNLIVRGARQFKFVDRTFNLNLQTTRRILEFLLEHHRPGMFYHFEMVPDRMPNSLRDIIRRFPEGTLQFEMGVQSFHPEVTTRIGRRQNISKVDENFQFLRDQTGVHIHSDLVLGLPGESLESIAAGFDRLIAMRPQEIQVGILKRLRGAPIARHDEEWGMVYSPFPPYEILQNRLISFETMQRLRRFARYWDLVGNSGRFVESTPLIWHGQSPFQGFLSWSDWLYGQVKRTDAIALNRIMELLFSYLTEDVQLAPEMVAGVMWRDCQRAGHREKPGFILQWIPAAAPEAGRRSRQGPKRQARHSS